MNEINIGVLSIQGDVAENIASTEAALKELGINGKVTQVKTPEQISKLDGLIIPGGESTVMGLILLSKKVKDRVVGETDQPLLDLLDVKVERNSFGRQRDSFEAEVSLEPVNISKFNGVFIRAPSITEVGNDVEVISDISLHKYFVKILQQSLKDQ